MLFFFSFYWGLTIIEVALIANGYVNIQVLEESVAQLLLSPLHMDLLVYLAVLCSGYSFTYYKRSRQQTIRNKELSEQLLQVELQSLKSQLNPHFLFNTLNTIASLIRLDDKRHAIKALSELSFMLRKVLENQRHQLISLEQEVEFIQSYLTIQKMRFSHKLKTSVNIDNECLPLEVPFMLLQPLVENAVQHGSQLESDENELKLSIYCRDNYLHVKLINKIPEKDEHKGFGIGLSNCRKRLEKLFELDFQLVLTPLESGYFETYLCMPIGVLDA
ncbi:histidine kinase [Thalassotalea sp. M1531]|uniref:Histidine kinase n=2 Tax=Thalassotalea algicola TaxID=2716224 RepID=A0A7Y0LFQ8_9GAMM|nr:histidine kinase [Thalassotalea algicola]